MIISANTYLHSVDTCSLMWRFIASSTVMQILIAVITVSYKYLYVLRSQGRSTEVFVFKCGSYETSIWWQWLWCYDLQVVSRQRNMAAKGRSAIVQQETKPGQLTSPDFQFCHHPELLYDVLHVLCQQNDANISRHKCNIKVYVE